MKRVILLLSVLLSLSLILAGCSKSEGELTKVRLSEVTHSIFYAPQYVALTQGFFEEEGLEIELINSQGADKVMTAVLSGQVDIGFAGPEHVSTFTMREEQITGWFCPVDQWRWDLPAGRDRTLVLSGVI